MKNFQNISSEILSIISGLYLEKFQLPQEITQWITSENMNVQYIMFIPILGGNSRLEWFIQGFSVQKKSIWTSSFLTILLDSERKGLPCWLAA